MPIQKKKKKEKQRFTELWISKYPFWWVPVSLQRGDTEKNDKSRESRFHRNFCCLFDVTGSVWEKGNSGYLAGQIGWEVSSPKVIRVQELINVEERCGDLTGLKAGVWALRREMPKEHLWGSSGPDMTALETRGQSGACAGGGQHLTLVSTAHSVASAQERLGMWPSHVG